MNLLSQEDFDQITIPKVLGTPSPDIDIDQYIDDANSETGLPKNLIRAVIKHESGGRFDARPIDPITRQPLSSAYGLMQITEGTARDLGIDRTDPRQNVIGGSRYLRDQIDRFGNVELGLAAYFKGPDTIEQYGLEVPGTTGGTTARDYVQKITTIKDTLDQETLQKIMQDTDDDFEPISIAAPAQPATEQQQPSKNPLAPWAQFPQRVASAVKQNIDEEAQGYGKAVGDLRQAVAEDTTGKRFGKSEFTRSALEGAGKGLAYAGGILNVAGKSAIDVVKETGRTSLSVGKNLFPLPEDVKQGIADKLKGAASAVKSGAAATARPVLEWLATDEGLQAVTELAEKDPATFKMMGDVFNIAMAVPVTGAATSKNLRKVAAGKIDDAATAASRTSRSIINKVQEQVAEFSDIPEEVLMKVADKTVLKRIGQAYTETKGDLSQLGDDVVNMVKDIRGKAQDELERNTGTFKGYLAGRGQQAAEEAEGTIRASRPIAGESLTSKADIGTGIGEQVTKAKAETRDAFNKRIEKILDESGIGGKPLRPTESIEFGTARGTPYRESPAVDAIDNLFFEMGHTGKFTGRESIGETAIPSNVIGHLKQMRKMDVFRNPRNTRELLNARRQLQNTISWSKDKGALLYPKGSPGHFVMKRLYGNMNKLVEDQLVQLAPDAKTGSGLVRAYRANNAQAEQILESLNQLSTKGGMASSAGEAYVDKIKRVGVKNLARINHIVQSRYVADESRDAMSAVWQEIKNGYFDGLLLKATKGNGFDFKAFDKVWSGEDKALRQLLVGKDNTKKVRDALVKYNRIRNSLDRIKPDQAVKGLSKYKPSENIEVAKVSDIGKKFVGATPDVGNTVKKLENIGSKDKRQALLELSFLEDLYGVPEKDKISNMALDVYMGKQLKLSNKGNLKMIAKPPTGRSLLGLVLGTKVGAAIGAFLGGPAGAAVGGGTGVVAGMLAQSPMGAVSIYRNLEKLELGLGKEFYKNLMATTAGATALASTVTDDIEQEQAE